MSTKDNYSKTLRFSAETDEKLGKLAQRFTLSKFQFFNKMVEYFHRTKKDPADINDEVLKNTLVKNHDTYIPVHPGAGRKNTNPGQDRS